jgi:hypothetical protein
MTNYAKYPDHPYVAMFPLMTGQPFDNLVEDIRKYGQKVPCERYKGKTLDGRNRIRACVILKIKPIIVEWRPADKKRDVETQILEFIVSINLHRRQLSESQRALIAAEYYEKIKGRAGGHRPVAHGLSVDKAADLFQINKSYVYRGAAILAESPKATIRDIQAGEKSISVAYFELDETGKRDRTNERGRVLRSFRHSLKLWEKRFPEFDDVWGPMRKRLERLAEAETA